MDFNNIKKEIGKRIKELRHKKNESQEEFADAIGLSQNSISKIERGEVALTLDNLIRLTEHFNVSFDYICSGSNKESLLDVLQKYIQVCDCSLGSIQSINLELKINSTLINYLLMAKKIDILATCPDTREILLQDEKDTFYKMIKDDNETGTYLGIPLTNNDTLIIPDDYKKEWSVLGVKNDPCK